MARERNHARDNETLYSRALGGSVQEGPSHYVWSFNQLLAISATLLTLTFLVDFFTPADINIPLFYPAAILAAIASRSRKLVWSLALAAAALSYLGVFLGAPPDVMSMSAVLTNRTLSVVMIIAVATIGDAWIAKAAIAAEKLGLIRQLAETFDLAQAIIRNAHGEILFWSRGAQRLYGYSAEEATGRISHELLRTEFPEPLRQIDATVQATSHWNGELRHTRKDGERIWVASDWAMGPANGKLTQVVVEVNTELTRLKRTETALQASESRFHRLSESNLAGVVIADFDRVLEANDEFLKMLGYSRDDLHTLTWNSIIAPDEVAKHLQSMKELKELGTSRAIETEFLDKLGKPVPVLVGSVTIDGTFLSLVSDQTDRKRLQKQLLQAQKFDSLGKLAGGVAHDFNNLLTVISGNVELVLACAWQDPSLKKRLQAVADAAERATTLTRQLLNFSRHQPEDALTLGINEVVLSSEPILRQLIREDIHLVLNLDPRAGVIRANPVQIDQVLFNLVVNARDAMPNGGEIVIETAGLLVDQEYAGAHVGMKPGTYTLLTVTDTGTGMPEHVKEHAFEPFFTTKDPGHGTGLGLATVYAAVINMGGAISLYSEPEQGTVFKILFPTVGEPEPLAAAPLPEREMFSAPTGGTILVAEDEPALRDYIRDVLEFHGYRVIEAKNGREALQVAQAFDGPIDLLLTDLVMPELGGDDLSARFQEIRPQVPILRMSGYTDRTVREPNTRTRYIQKPFTPNALMNSIRTLLGA
jgi:PAS domain S-box-containing protein